MLTDEDLRQVLSEYADLAPEPSDLALSTPGSSRAVARQPRRWITAVSAAAAVAVLAGGAAVWAQAGRHFSGAADPGPDAVSACRTALPAPWSAAASAGAIRIPGARYVDPLAFTGNGTLIVDWVSADGTVHLTSVSPSGVQTQIYQQTVPAGHGMISVLSDGTTAVIGIAPMLPAGNPAPAALDDITVVNLGTRAARNVLSAMPQGYLVNPGKVLIVQAGSIYWATHTDQVPQSDALMKYTPSTGKYTPVPADTATVNWSSLGISWNGGTIPAPNVPDNAPPASEHHLSIATDGTAYAWSTYQDPGTIQWADSSGQRRTVTQDVAAQISIDGVAGPYVFLTSGEGSDSDTITGNTLYVLDTRSGALAPFGTTPNGQTASRGSRFALSEDLLTDGVLAIDTASLPPLTC